MLTKIILEDNVSRSYKLIEAAERIVILTHLSPDGDAVGSSLGLYHFLKEIGKEPVVIVPNRFPGFLNWMSGAADIVVLEEKHKEVQGLITEADLLICVDFNDLKRIDGAKPFVEQSHAKKILIDHHLLPEAFADVTISHPEISSSSELVFRLICRMGFFQNITQACAESIYVGMMTDTGNFSYASQSPEIYHIISELLSKGIDKDNIYRLVYNTYSENRMRLMGFCLVEKMKLYKEQRTAVISLSLDELARFDYQVGDAEGFVNIPLSIEGIDISVFVREDVKKVKMSFRSQGTFPVNKMASTYFNGGGHLNAAGGESYLSLAETLDKLEKVIIKNDIQAS
ncbi:MAG: bifunctional oligoribonuclease/PAP phosphatase NrnA [Prevotellaceae bacterium]|nr:bifunctional oligoribonuclease/PAP phosphatase NrnA [Prevotellaceae bacterium]